jgi:multidrug efflux system membrane fusion protein
MSTAGIQRGVPGTFVYLINPDNTVSVRPVKLGVTAGDRMEVLSGLAPGDRVVIDGADKLRDGAKIIIRSENAASPPPAASPDARPGAKKRRSEDGQKQ